MKVLIADDEFSTRETLTMFLKKWGYQPVIACDGSEAWRAMQVKGAPRMIVLDWMMPGMDGIEICRKLRQREKNGETPVYIILLTMLGAKKHIVEGLEAGADDYIVKPHDNNELRARLAVGKRMVNLQNTLIETIDTLTYQAFHDFLTRTFNRNYIFKMLEKEISRAKREGTRLSIGMFDIDNFKGINDKYGHQTGDDVLFGVVHRIKSGMRSYDYLGRFGGDEFLLVNPGGVPLNVMDFYKRICALVGEKSFLTRNQNITVTVSIGVTSFSKDKTIDDMVADADKALYQAKQNGRNQVVIL